MQNLILPIAIIIVLAVAVWCFDFFLRSRKPRFNYTRKNGLMTPAELECYQALVTQMGADYDFFPQIHLDAIVSPAATGKSRLYAFRHINQKSVDFVACLKNTSQPVLAIEVDDKTHTQPKRIARDQEVERILHGACIPLVRIENHGRFDPKTLSDSFMRGIKKFSNQPL